MPLTEDQILELRRSYHAFDSNGNGFIEENELKEGLKLLGYDISGEGVTHLLSMVKSKDNKLNFEEFITWNHLLWEDDMRTKFKKIDADVSGWIGKNELKTWVLNMGYGFSEEELDDMCYEMDTNGDDRISVDEFISGMAVAKKGNSYFVIEGEMYIEKLKTDFNAMDADKSGYVTRSDLQEMAKQVNYILSQEELDRTMQDMDYDGDGKISIEEFMAATIKMKNS